MSGNAQFTKIVKTEYSPTLLASGVDVLRSNETSCVGALSSGALVVAAVGTGLALTDTMLSSLVNPGFLLLGPSSGGSPVLTLGADTSARATALLDLLGVEPNKPRLLNFKHWGLVNAGVINLANDTASGTPTSNNVQVSLSGGAKAAIQALSVGAAATTDAWVIAKVGTPTTAGEASILFDIVRQSIVQSVA